MVNDILTIRNCVIRAREEGLASVNEHWLRVIVRSGEVPVRYAGNRAMLYYPSIVAYITCANEKGEKNE